MLECLWQRNRAFFRSLIIEIVRDRSRVDDVLQDSLLRLLRYRPPHRYRTRDYPLLRRVVFTTAIDHRRRLLTVGRQLESNADPDPLDLLLIGEEEHSHRACLLELPKAVDQLPETLRIAVKAYYWRNGKTVREVSKELGMPSSTLRSRTNAGVRLLRLQLGGLDCFREYRSLRGLEDGDQDSLEANQGG